jgi:hypothetical protein
MDTLQLALSPAAAQPLWLWITALAVTAVVAGAAGLFGGVILGRKLGEDKIARRARGSATTSSRSPTQGAGCDSEGGGGRRTGKRAEREKRFAAICRSAGSKSNASNPAERREDQFDKRGDNWPGASNRSGDKESRLDNAWRKPTAPRWTPKRASRPDRPLRAGVRTQREQAKKLLLEQLETELHADQAATIRRVEAETNRTGEKKRGGSSPCDSALRK